MRFDAQTAELIDCEVLLYFKAEHKLNRRILMNYFIYHYFDQFILTNLFSKTN